MTSSTEGRRASSSAPRGTSKGTSASRRVRFARTSRCAIVASLTRKARAISGVASPPSSRSVSATRASRGSTGWQQVKIRPSRSSPTSSSTATSNSERSIAIRMPTSRASSSCLRSRVVWRRARSIARFLAVAISQAPGLSGTPDSGQRSSAATSASWARSSARPTSRTIRANPATRRADSIRQTASIAWLVAAPLIAVRPSRPLPGRPARSPPSRRRAVPRPCSPCRDSATPTRPPPPWSAPGSASSRRRPPSPPRTARR